MKLNMNRLIVGVLLVVSVVLIMGAMGSSPGRYQISGNGTCVWLVDTETGRVWVSEKRTVETDQSWAADTSTKWYSYGAPGQSSTQ